MTSFAKRSITSAAAQLAIEAAEKKAQELGLKITAVVCDEAGEVKAMRRMDGASVLSVKIATGKAYSAAAAKTPTHLWYDRIKDDAPLLHGIVHTPGLVIFGGGLPIKVDDEVVGSIGISGGHYSQDTECAEAGVRAVGGA